MRKFSRLFTVSMFFQSLSEQLKTKMVFNFMSSKKTAMFITMLAGLFFTTNLFSQEPDLFRTIVDGDTNAVEKLITSGTDLNQQNELGRTPLIVACLYKDVEMAKYLISKDVDINIKANNGVTALLAVASHSRELTELLISKGADIKAKSEEGGLFTQCTIGILTGSVSIELAEILLSKGADIEEATNSDPDYKGYTPLIMASNMNNEELIKFLIKNGANVNVKANDGTTPLSHAFQAGHTNIIEILKAAGAK